MKAKNMKATFNPTTLPSGAVRYSVLMNGKTQSTYTGGAGYHRSEQEARNAAIFECKRINGEISVSEDGNFGLIVGSALRYALPRHSYMVFVVADFIKRHWQNPAIQRQRHTILRDIKEFLDERNEEYEMFGGMDYRAWKNLYNNISQR